MWCSGRGGGPIGSVRAPALRGRQGTKAKLGRGPLSCVAGDMVEALAPCSCPPLFRSTAADAAAACCICCFRCFRSRARRSLVASWTTESDHRRLGVVVVVVLVVVVVVRRSQGRGWVG